MANVISYNDVIDILRDLAQRHYQLNTFFLGRDWELENNQDIVYPVLQVYPENARMPITVAGDYKTVEINLICKIVDLVAQGEANERDVHSDTLRIAQDVVNQLNQHPFYIRSNISLIGDIIFSNLEEYEDDFTAGWSFNLNLRLINNNSYCGLPMAELSGYSSNGPITTGYSTSVQYLTCATVTGCTTLQNYITNSIGPAISGGTYISSSSTLSFQTLNGNTINITGITAGGGGDSYFTSGSSGNYSVKQITNTTTDASASFAFAFGTQTTASGVGSAVFGDRAQANGYGAFATGIVTQAYGQASNAEGTGTFAGGDSSHAEGFYTNSTGDYSHAGGINSVASGQTSFVHGNASRANGANTIVLGAGITGNTNNTTYVDYLNVKSLTGTSISALGVDSNGNVVSGASSVSTQQTYMLTSGASSYAGYYNAVSLPLYTASTLVTTGTTVTTSGTLLGRFATTLGFPNLVSIASGEYSVHFETQKLAGSNNYFSYAEIYKISSAGTETLLGTTDNSSVSSLNTILQVNVTASLPATTLYSTDRIGIKIYAKMVSSTATINLLYDDATESRFSLPIIITDVNSLVPYTGAITNVNLGTHSLSATNVFASTISATTYYNIPTVFGTGADNNNGTISSGSTGYVTMGHAGRITGWDLIGSPSGTIIYNIWKSTTSALPTSANTIVDNNKPQITAGSYSGSTTLTNWTGLTYNAGDKFGFYIEYVTGFTNISLTLRGFKEG